MGKDLSALAEELAAQGAADAHPGRRPSAPGPAPPTGCSARSRRAVELSRGGHRVVGYPALVDEGGTVGVTVAENAERQRASPPPRAAPARPAADPRPDQVGGLPPRQHRQARRSGTSPYASVPALLADARLASVGELIRRAGGDDTRDEATFRRLCDTVRVDNADQMRSIVHVVAQTLTLRQRALALVPRAAAVAPGRRGGRRRAGRQPGLRRGSSPPPRTSTWSTCRATCQRRRAAAHAPCSPARPATRGAPR